MNVIPAALWETKTGAILAAIPAPSFPLLPSLKISFPKRHVFARKRVGVKIGRLSIKGLHSQKRHGRAIFLSRVPCISRSHLERSRTSTNAHSSYLFPLSRPLLSSGLCVLRAFAVDPNSFPLSRWVVEKNPPQIA